MGNFSTQSATIGSSGLTSEIPPMCFSIPTTSRLISSFTCNRSRPKNRDQGYTNVYLPLSYSCCLGSDISPVLGLLLNFSPSSSVHSQMSQEFLSEKVSQVNVSQLISYRSIWLLPSLFKIRQVIHSPLSQEFLSEKVSQVNVLQ